MGSPKFAYDDDVQPLPLSGNDMEEFEDADLPHESEQSYLDINLTEASVYLELAMDECDDGEIGQDIMRSYRSLIKALTKAQERRDDE